MNDKIRDIIRKNSNPLAPHPTGQSALLRPLDNIKAVFFDVYGTLFVSASGDIGATDSAACSEAFADALDTLDVSHRLTNAQGVERLNAEIVEEHGRLRETGIEFPEVRILDVWRRTLECLSVDGLLERTEWDNERLACLATEYEVRANPCWPMPHCHETIKSIQQARILLGIVSNAQFMTCDLFPALLEQGLDQLGFQPERVLLSYEHQHAKPGLLMFELARERLGQNGVVPGEVLYVGNDMLNDVYAAGQVGFRTALFAGDQRSLRLRQGDIRVEGAVPDLVLTDLDQLPQCLGVE